MAFQQIFGATPLRPKHTDFDILSDEGGRLKSRGRVVYASDFSQGHDGWATHFTAGAQRLGVSLSSENSIGSRGLMMSTAEKPYEATDAAGNLNSCGAFRRMGSYGTSESSIVSLSAYVAVRSGGQINSYPSWSTFSIMFDMQRHDNTSRNFPVLYYADRSDPDWTLSQDPILEFNTGLPPGYDPANLPPSIGGGVKTVSGSANTATGENEEKMNVNYMRLTFDRGANGGLGAYYEVQMNHFHADMSYLTPATGACALYQLQGSTPDEIAQNRTRDFRGGFNCGLAVARQHSTTYPAVAIFAGICVTQNDVPA
jgi:hypothetical protein